MTWIKVEDALPEILEGQKSSKDVLAVCVSHGNSKSAGFVNSYLDGEKYFSIDAVVKWSDGHKTCFRTDRFYGKVTHWMPLPDFPEKEI
jgi:hypothetical protein